MNFRRLFSMALSWGAILCLGVMPSAPRAADEPPAPAPGLVAETGGPDGETVLRVGDEAPFHRTRNRVTGLRLIAVPGGSGDRVALWNEAPSGGGPAEPFYAIGLAGAPLGEGRATSYLLKLRYAEFDPAFRVPQVAPLLAADGTTKLHVVQFVTQPLESFRGAIRESGGIVRGYLAHHAQIVELPHDAARDRVASLPFVRWVGPYHPGYRLEESLLDDPAGARERVPRQRYNILVFDAGPAGKPEVAKRIAAIGGAVDSADAGKFLLQATLTAEQLFQVVRWDEVQFVDRWGPYEKDMDIVREISGADYLETVAGYTGQGVRAEVFDAGFNVNHPDFASRPLLVHGGAVGLDSHGTATAGICFGDGTGDPTARGLLPDGQGIVADYTNVGLTGASRYTHTGELLQAPYFAVFQTASVGSSRTTQYSTISADHDTLLFDWDILHCQSQSNAGDQMSRPQAWAKNVVSGGAFNHYNTLSKADDCWCGTASIGPAADGRIKPDLSFFYDATWTTYSTGSGYGSFGGTSGATPSICGYAGLFFQMWSDGIFGNEFDPQGTVFDNRPHMTTAKAFLINTADQHPFTGTTHDMTRVHQGWGMPSARNLYDLRNNISFIDESVLLGNLESVEYVAIVDPGEPALKVTLTYADPAGNPASTQHRINDLTLKVTSPSSVVYWGNNGLRAGNWSTPGGAADTIDTVENVFVENPQDGIWFVEVIASEVNQDGHVETPALDADFALVVSGAFLKTCSSDGQISLSGSAYACEDSATIRVVDCDLNLDDNAVETVSVTIDSGSEPAGENVLLTETDAATAVFEGTIPLSQTDAAGVLWVAPGDLVTATYVDADDGLGGTNVTKTDQAAVDCAPPVITNVAATNVGPHDATVTFDTDEPARGTVRYGLTCASLTQSAAETGFVTAHSIVLGGLAENTTYFYAVDAEDQVGNIATEDNAGACYTFTTTDVPDFFTEEFGTDNDVDFLRFTFTPDGSADYYAGCSETISAFPNDPLAGTALSLSDDSFATVTLSGGSTVSLYGVAYGTFYVGSNGYITFTSGSSDYTESLAEHFAQPRISALYDDLNPASAGTVRWQQLADRVVVTWDSVTEYGTTNSNNLQVEMFFDGTITLNYLAVAAGDGIVGLSEGNGVSPDYLESDLSAMLVCGAATCSDGVLNQGEDRIDCGGPCPPCQCLSDEACDDGLFCNGWETCDAFGTCQPAGDPCPGQYCDEVNDLCIECYTNADCDDGLFCNGQEICLANNFCQAGADPCPWKACDEVAGACLVCDDDGSCEPGEDCGNCPGDCISGGNPAYCCGDGTCESVETAGNCAADCTPTVPGEAGAGALLLVTGYDQVSGMLSISYGVPCSATDHTIEYGELTRANLEAYNWSGQECALGVSGVYDWSTTGTPASIFFVVVANNGNEEGSYGRTGAGVERSEDLTGATCPMAQNLQYACP